MKRFVALGCAFAFFSVGHAFGEKAKAQNVPEIPFPI
jgi:hypothetical protein